MKKLRLSLSFLLIIGTVFTLSAQRKKSTTRLSPAMNMPESLIVLPSDYDPQESYPLLILMPYTGGSSFDFFNKYLKEAKIDEGSWDDKFAAFLDIYKTEFGEDRSFILMLTHGDGSKAHHNFNGFMSCIEQMERRLAKDLPKFFNKYSINQDKVFIGGVSLGGDLSWALSLRQPELLQGAIVTASRCSYPAPKGALERLAEKDYSFFMAMGMSESPDRLSGMSDAKKQLAAHGIAHTYREMPYLNHDRAPIWMFMEAIEYVMFKNHKALIKLTKPEVVNMVAKGYEGELFHKIYTMQDRQEILRRGGGVWELQEESSQTEIKLQITSNDESDLVLSFQEGELSKVNLKAHLVYTPDNQLAIFIPEQTINGILYKGISPDIDSQAHGIFVIQSQDGYISFDLEKYALRNANKRETYSFFALINMF